MKLSNDILRTLNATKVVGVSDISIQKIQEDSRQIERGDLFVATRGVEVDGHQYIDNAIKNGAAVIVCETIPNETNANVCYILVKDSHQALGILANHYYQNPSEKLKLIGVTGTNGKTTTTSLSYDLFKILGYKVGLISTIQIMVNGEIYDTINTTPSTLTTHYYLDKMVQAGVTHCFMEVSSHGIHQNRIAGLYFAGGVFTNITHDHLDYHHTFDAYRDTKKSFFDHLSKEAFALVNIDDRNGSVMLQNTQAKKYSYALKSNSDYKLRVIENSFHGLHLSINNKEVFTQLIGRFNAYNILSVYAIAILLGVDDHDVLTAISTLKNVSGRFEYISSESRIVGIVDYAHTPDALKNVLDTIKDIKKENQKTITVVGCGGNRDISKRPIMGKIATEYSDIIILTSDNPRDENPQEIINEIQNGIPEDCDKKVIQNIDRVQAIQTACLLANAGDVVLVAGKGHENYQETKGERIYFDDVEQIKTYLK